LFIVPGVPFAINSDGHTGNGCTLRENIMTKTTLEKIFEYASMPVHGTLSRKLRKDIKLQINEAKIYESAVFFLGEEFVRVTETAAEHVTNTYYDWDKIISVRTIAPETK
jgi:hypothetical protein